MKTDYFRKTIAILEDNDCRISEMRSAIEKSLSTNRIVIFDAAPLMIDWLKQNIEIVALLSLDFDLPIKRNDDNELIDYGTGGDVAEFIAPYFPAFPILIHSSNPIGVVQMEQILNTHGWSTTRVYPYEDMAWIKSSWVFEVKKCLALD